MLPDTVEITVEVTDGQTFEELLDHLREALALCLEDAAELNFVASPRMILSGPQSS
ncbi:MAG: hypothetical protein JXA10_14910 [Anaerolineae bacterium]|nr:hypothetical protein [Anaerolineae bacterium]